MKDFLEITPVEQAIQDYAFDKITKEECLERLFQILVSKKSKPGNFQQGHGTTAEYNKGCRCLACLQAQTYYYHDWYSRNREKRADTRKDSRLYKTDAPCGTTTKYGVGRCRCQLCKDAHAEAARKRTANKRRS